MNKMTPWMALARGLGYVPAKRFGSDLTDAQVIEEMERINNKRSMLSANDRWKMENEYHRRFKGG